MLFLLLTTLGCRNKDLAIDTAGLVSVDDSTTVDSGRIDADGDGVAAAEDCDDTNPDISPLADEVCDEVDNDCDGEVDEDPVDGPSWYADEDGDGYGAGEGTIACEAPEGLVEYDGDCDDADSAWHPGAVEDDCTDPNDYNCDGSVGWEDGDGDGFAACEECDDGDASIHPDGEEVCDGADNNCDGQVDEDSAVDAGTWYQDADGDGFGDLDETTVACAAPEGFVEASTDCDDTDAEVNPDAAEFCDSIDNDCDGTIDEDDAVDASTWYADTDGDGYGDAKVSSAACEQPSGSVSDSTDCDDSASATYPGADEYCDGVDTDCDGTLDEDDALDAPTWYSDTDSDGYGDLSTAANSCSQPSGTVSDDTDCDDGASATYPGADEYCDGVDTDCDGTLDEDDALDAPTWYSDTDSDGYGDLSTAANSCSQPSGTVSDSTDCDDSASATYPGADEYCDGVDTDCDGSLDESDALDAPSWYADADSDGFGDANTSQASCSQPGGGTVTYIADDTDCDDSTSATYPGADEYCDGVDTDCDGTLDEDDALDALTWYGDGDGDGYGSGTGTASCSQPSSTASIDGDCDEGDSAINPGASEVCDGVDNDCDSSVDETGCPCNVKSYGGKSYLFCTSGQSWTNASATCASYGYHLLDVQNAAENSWADSTADTYSTGKWWIGLNDRASEGTWAWDGGAAVTYTNWHSGEPNNSGNEDCVQFNRFHPSQTWNDEGCGQALPYICEN